MAEHRSQRIVPLTRPLSRLVELDIPESHAGPAITGPAAVTLGPDGVELRLKGRRRRVRLSFRDLVVLGDTDDGRRSPNNRKYLLGR